MYIREVDKGAYSDHFFDVFTTTMGNGEIENDEGWQEPRRRDIEEVSRSKSEPFCTGALKRIMQY